ncbi:DNA ligase 1-like [Benincasa hispida]|uniref:DNA ligase 1-like n=1 Tax=Benincasa hispida TaxID=102211 RepID=UPI0018FF8819|nr:DNA ligase 1-like [Benincasa hispida]
MADQTPNQSASPSTPDQVAMREAAFLATRRENPEKPSAVRPSVFKRGGSTESIPMLTPTVSTESERKRRDDTEVFGNILSTLEQGGGLPEAGVVNQPLTTEEKAVVVAEEAVKDGRREEEEIAIEEAKEAEVALETPDIAMEEVAGDTQPEGAKKKEKKKKKSKGKKAGEAESSHYRKARKNKEKKYDDEDKEAKKERKKKEKEERKLCRCEERT